MTTQAPVVHQQELSIKFLAPTRFTMLACLGRLGMYLAATKTCDVWYRSFYYDTDDFALREEGTSLRLADRLDEVDLLAAVILKRRLSSNSSILRRQETAVCVSYDWRSQQIPLPLSLADRNHFALSDHVPGRLRHVATSLQRRRKLACRPWRGCVANISADEVSWHNKLGSAYQIGIEINGHVNASRDWIGSCESFLDATAAFCLTLGLQPLLSTKLEELALVPSQ